ncbi:ImmA/IrrE family metallo-endopeptidase [Corynebacterium mendelii]|uniref:ImmA/IrrE family metallo-endopeptidase n=1 Tax=Corynebacterium mendelii TaxID=2765362 RepID=UPI003645EFFB
MNWGTLSWVSPVFFGDEEEQDRAARWCNRFAAEFPLPGVDIVERFSGKKDTLQCVEKQARTYGVSREAVTWRLVDRRKISHAEAETLIASVPPVSRRKKDGGGSDTPHGPVWGVTLWELLPRPL